MMAGLLLLATQTHQCVPAQTLLTHCYLVIQRDLDNIFADVSLALHFSVHNYLIMLSRWEFYLYLFPQVIYKTWKTCSDTDPIVNSSCSRETVDYSYLLFVFPST